MTTYSPPTDIGIIMARVLRKCTKTVDSNFAMLCQNTRNAIELVVIFHMLSICLLFSLLKSSIMASFIQ